MSLRANLREWMEIAPKGAVTRIKSAAPEPEYWNQTDYPSRKLPLCVFINAGRVLRKHGLERAEDYVRASVDELTETEEGAV